ncbi:MAG: hypothetical protein K2M94_00885 [Paramuribaculum sp.]|nr:hypothetical protein [Paramuribaculum sp.]
MADNYLERKMEAYRNGASKLLQFKSSSTKPVMVIIGAEGEVLSKAINTLTEAGCKVTFCSTDTAGGYRMAQTSGSQFYPVKTYSTEDLRPALDFVTAKRGKITMILTGEEPIDCDALLPYVAPATIFASLTDK